MRVRWALLRSIHARDRWLELRHARNLPDKLPVDSGRDQGEGLPGAHRVSRYAGSLHKSTRVQFKIYRMTYLAPCSSCLDVPSEQATRGHFDGCWLFRD
jgi:hypothetical protein